MHAQFLTLLQCPETQTPLTLTPRIQRDNGFVVEGMLQSESGRIYPIIRGIPRFVAKESYSKSWGFEWNFWPRVQFEDHLKGTPMEGATRTKLERITRRKPHEFSEKVICEFGYGPGHFMDVMRQGGAKVAGLDMSQAVEACRKNFPEDPDVLVVQADMTSSPFRDHVFDGAMGIGCFHHLPVPETGVRELARIVKPGGWGACAVYTATGDYARRSVARHRAFFQFLAPLFGAIPPLIYSYFSAYALTAVHNLLYKIRLGAAAEFLQRNAWVVAEFPNADFRACDVFDMITPTHASTHTPEQVRNWLLDAGFSEVLDSDWNASAKIGLK